MSKKKKSKKEEFILNSVTIGTALTLKYQAYNERMSDYRNMAMKEKENWHPDFGDCCRDIAELAAKECTLDTKSESIRTIRAKKLSFEGLKCKAELIIYKVGSLDPFTVKTHTFQLDVELKKQITEEARAYAYNEKRLQGDLFAASPAIIKNDLEEHQPEIADEGEEVDKLAKAS